MKRIFLSAFSMIFFVSIVFGQNQINYIKYKSTSTVELYFQFETKNVGNNNFSIFAENKTRGNIKIFKPNYKIGLITLTGVAPGDTLALVAKEKNKIISDTLIITPSQKLIPLNSRSVIYRKDIDSSRINIDGIYLDKNGNIFGSYCERGYFKKNIQTKGPKWWTDNNGIIGVLENGNPFLFSGRDPIFPEDGINYYNTGLGLVKNKVVFSQKRMGVSWFLQDGPILIYEGRVIISDTSYKQRAALCFDGNRMYYAVSFKKTTIKEFSQFLIDKGIDKALLLHKVGFSDRHGIYGNFDKENMKILFLSSE